MTTQEEMVTQCTDQIKVEIIIIITMIEGGIITEIIIEMTTETFSKEVEVGIDRSCMQMKADMIKVTTTVEEQKMVVLASITEEMITETTTGKEKEVDSTTTETTNIEGD